MLKNITLSAEKDLIKKAREKALRQKKTLNVVFHEWLARYTDQTTNSNDYATLMQELQYAHAGKHFSRDELNEQ